MHKLSFPINYFMSIFTPRAMFKGRKNLNWFGILFIFIFLNALLLMPIPLFYAKTGQVNMQPFMPKVESMLSNKDMQSYVNKTSYSQQRREFNFNQEKVIYKSKDKILGINLSKKEMNKSAVVNLTSKTFTFKENKLSFISKYQSSKNPHNSMKDFVENSWYLENRGYIATMMLMMLGTVIIVINIFVSLGAAFLLYLSHKSVLSDIKTFKESVNLILNALGLGVIIAVIMSLINFNIMFLIFLPTVWMVLMIAFIYMQTRFKDTN